MTRLEHQMTADVPEWGYKFHMNDILAAIGLCNLDGLGSVIKAHRYNVKYYMEHLKDIKGLMLPVVPEDSIPSWWSFYIFVDDRDKFIKKMEEKGIVTTPMWRRNDLYSTFKDMPTSTLENMDKLQDKIIFIPVGWWLKEKDLEYIVKSIKEVMNE
jgi:dTDP-4-amino-4,6-dideoxygalactose transaminase